MVVSYKFTNNLILLVKPHGVINQLLASSYHAFQTRIFTRVHETYFIHTNYCDHVALPPPNLSVKF